MAKQRIRVKKVKVTKTKTYRRQIKVKKVRVTKTKTYRQKKKR